MIHLQSKQATQKILNTFLNNRSHSMVGSIKNNSAVPLISSLFPYQFSFLSKLLKLLSLLSHNSLNTTPPKVETSKSKCTNQVEGNRKATAKRRKNIVQEQPNLDKRHHGFFFFFFLACSLQVSSSTSGTLGMSVSIWGLVD